MTKPLSKDLSHLLNAEAKGRNPSPLKMAFKYFNDPNVIFLGGGLPLPEYFPFNSISAESINPPFPNGINAAPTKEDHLTVHASKYPDESGDIPLSVSLQYGATQGPEIFLQYIRDHTKIVHNVAYEDWDVILTIGNTQAWDATLRTFTERGDPILVEEFTFSSSLEAASGMGLVSVPMKTDLNGIIPEKLEAQLDNWVGKKPKILYTIPTGQNPTGSTLSRERREAIYGICQKHDLILVEDEPYYFLQMPTYEKDPSKREQSSTPSHKDFLSSLVPSFLEFDVDGRVVRLDSFSKVIAPGCRIGWVVAQKRLVERYLRQHEVTIQVASGFAQSAVYGLLRRWGQEGYLDWLIGLRKAYTEKRDVALDAMEKYLPKDLTEFIAPTAGMFFWIKADGRSHPKYKEFGGDALKIEMDVYETGLKAGVLMIPGHWFVADGETVPPQLEEGEKDSSAIYFRGNFASVPHDKLQKAIEIFGQHLKNTLTASK